VDRPFVPTVAPVRVGQHHDRGPEGHTAAGARRGARVENVQGGRGHLDRHVPDRDTGGDRRGPAGRRGHVAAVRVRPGNGLGRDRAGPDTGHGPVRGHGQIPEGGGGAPDPDRPLFR